MPSQEKDQILVVDDTPTNIQVLNSLLSEKYQVLFATNGRDALTIAKRELPDLILLDIMMPDMDGFTVCKHLKASPETHDIPVIFVTAMGNETDESKGLELGAIDYITKPIVPAIVKIRVDNHIELKRNRDLLKRLSNIDGLTGIANRRLFNEQIEKHWVRAINTGMELSLILFDVDYFKKYNDNYGHLAGDDCLRRIADILSNELNDDSALLARFGGEEFVCILPDTGCEDAKNIANMLREKVYQARIPMGYSDIADCVTVSGGVATIKPNAKSALNEFINNTDALLYKAKKNGRNQIIGQSVG